MMVLAGHNVGRRLFDIVESAYGNDILVGVNGGWLWISKTM